MRSKTPLVLMEQLAMVLVFAMAAAICLQMFAFSGRLSKKNEAVAEAALIAQNVAEELKYTCGEDLFTWDSAGGIYFMEEGRFCIMAQEEESDISGLCKVRLKVLADDEVLFEIPVAWQEVKADG